MSGGKIIWAMDADGEVGKRPPLPRDQIEISAEMWCGMEDHYRANKIGPYARAKK